MIDCPPTMLERLDRYLDAAPRASAEPETVGPFTLFRTRAAWPYYARPRVGLESPIELADIDRLAERCRELELPLAIEWIGELTPSLERVARASGLEVEVHPLLVLETASGAPAAADGVEILTAEDPRLPVAWAVASVGFGAPGTAVGDAGVVERDEHASGISDELRAHLARRVAAGLTVTAIDADVLAAGSMIPVNDTAEIVGVATLPAHRRRGLAGAITRGLLAEAGRRGITLVLLSAGDEAIARIYAREGFRRVGTHLAAGAPG